MKVGVAVIDTNLLSVQQRQCLFITDFMFKKHGRIDIDAEKTWQCRSLIVQVGNWLRSAISFSRSNQ